MPLLQARAASRAHTAIALAVAVALALAGCSTPTETLESTIKDKPGVIRVVATEADGDDDLLFQSPPKSVKVRMEEDATASQVLAVFAAFKSHVESDEVSGVQVVLDGPKRVTLVTGAGTHATATMSRDLVAAQHDSDITQYRRQADPVLPSVELTLVPLDLEAVVAVANRYRDADEIDLVEVLSGGFTLIRDEVNEDLAFTDARERFVRRVNLRFDLTGAVIAGRGPLRVFVAPGHLAALREYVRSNLPAGTLGRVVVRVQR